MKKTVLAYLFCLAGAINASAQTDYTSKITNPSFENNGLTGWVSSGLSSQSNSSFAKKEGSVYVEKWVASGSNVGNASVSQTISNLPLGKYTLTVAAQNLKQSSTSTKCTGAYIYADAAQTPVYGPDDYSVDFENTTGKVTIGFIASGATGNWLAVDNFRLVQTEAADRSVVIAQLNSLLAQAEELAALDIDEKVKALLLADINAAKAIDDNSSDTEILNAMSNLQVSIEKGEFAKNLANATPGTGTPLKVTKTVTFVPTGATEALMRATMTGSNIMERGVCWSTDHNPTVLDARTTSYWSLNGLMYHITGLTPATVYYLRPYVMSKTYEVAYGDEVKIVTHPKGDCFGTWDEGAPTAEANERCRTAIKQTIDYFNEWTGIKGFTLSGHYGASTPTADCSYGGWMRIGPNAGNQAIGTVLHETGHGVGVGTSSRYADSNLHSWKWYGREANKIYSFLENKEANPYTSDFCMVGDGTHAWGSSATYDWFVNGADKDKHIELQYAGGCILLYGMFIDGLNPTGSYTNGLAGYTYNFDENKKYYIMCKNADFGLNTGLLTTGVMTAAGQNYYSVKWRKALAEGESVSENDAWAIEYNPQTGYYRFKSVVTGRYLSHGSSFSLKEIKAGANPGDTENFQLMPDRTDVTIGNTADKLTTHGYWFTWSGLKAMEPKALGSNGTGAMSIVDFNFSDTATKQQWIILTEEELRQYYPSSVPDAIVGIVDNTATESTLRAYNLSGQRVSPSAKGIIVVNGKKTLNR